MASGYMKRRSISLIIKEMQTKTTVRYHLMFIIMSVIQITRDSKCW